MTLPERLSRGAKRVSLRDAVQIAGVLDLVEARMLIECGVDFLGIPFAVPVHNEGLTEHDISKIAGHPQCRGRVVLITYLDRATDISMLCRRLGVNIVQLHGEIEREEIAKLRAMDPDLRVIKALVIGPFDAKAELQSTDPFVDAFITDTFDAKTGARGATGMTHDWRKSRDVVERASHPVILAGGLTPRNVGRAIAEVAPAAVDAHTGVEGEAGRKDPELVRVFVSEARAAFAMQRKGSQ